MAPFSDLQWIWPRPRNSGTLHEAARGLGMRLSNPLAAFFAEQNHAILVVGMTYASLRLLAALVPYQWFAFMKKSFRHPPHLLTHRERHVEGSLVLHLPHRRLHKRQGRQHVEFQSPGFVVWNTVAELGLWCKDAAG
jgi:hypothetical protein